MPYITPSNGGSTIIKKFIVTWVAPVDAEKIQNCRLTNLQAVSQGHERCVCDWVNDW